MQRASLTDHRSIIEPLLDQVSDHFNTSLAGDGLFNTGSALAADQSDTAATKTYTTSLLRDSGGTQRFFNGNPIGSSANFTDGQLITFVLSDATGGGLAVSASNGANDIVKMFVNGALTAFELGWDHSKRCGGGICHGPPWVAWGLFGL